MRLSRSLLAVGVAVVSFAGLTPSSRAAFTVTIKPDGLGNVVLNGSGKFNTSALTPNGTTFCPSTQFNPGLGYLIFGGSSGVEQAYDGFTPGGIFGTSGGHGTYPATGNLVGLYNDADIFVPNGYVSGQSLSDSAEIPNSTIAGLGLTPGTYTSTWGSGATADSYTIIIQPDAAVPEPSALGLLAIGSAGVLAWRRRTAPAR